MRFVRPPWWFITLTVVALLPVFSLPAMIGACPAGNDMMKMMIWMYPVVMAASAYYATVSYTPRTTLAWLMLLFMWLIDASMIYLTTTGFATSPEMVV